MWLWIEQYSWHGTKPASLLSSANQKRRTQMNVSFSPSQFLFRRPLEQRCLQIALFFTFVLGHDSKDRTFSSPLSLWGNLLLNSFQNRKRRQSKKERNEKNVLLPVPFSQCRAKCCCTVLPVPRCQLCQSHWPPSAGNSIASPTAVLCSEWARSITLLSECHSRLSRGIVFRVCELLYSLFTAAV